MHNVVALLQNVVSIHSTQLSVYKPKNKMSNKEINQLIAALIAAIAKHEQQETEKDNKLIIKGLDVSLEELQSSGDAQTKLIKLHNAMVEKIDELEERIAELEDQNN